MIAITMAKISPNTIENLFKICFKKIYLHAACKFCSVGFIIVGFQDTALLPNLKQKAI